MVQQTSNRIQGYRISSIIYTGLTILQHNCSSLNWIGVDGARVTRVPGAYPYPGRCKLQPTKQFRHVKNGNSCPDPTT